MVEILVMLNKQKVKVGQVVQTPGVSHTIHPISVVSSLSRHKRGDWGDVDDHDKKVNDEALEAGDRLLSSYKCGDTVFWIITEADRSVTTLLLPEEY